MILSRRIKILLLVVSDYKNANNNYINKKNKKIKDTMIEINKFLFIWNIRSLFYSSILKMHNQYVLRIVYKYYNTY